VHLLPNTPTHTAVSASSVADQQVPVVLTIGRLHPEKGLDVLLAASASMRRNNVRHRILIVGGVQAGYESYPQVLRQAAQRLGVTADVEFIGGVDDTAPWLQRASVYVQPSRREAFGLAVLEAMQAGRPVVASSVGGLPELVVDGVTGRLVRPDDPDALAAAITALINDPALRRAWGEAGRRRAEEHYGVDRFRAGVRDLYAAPTVGG
jgi:glycosyltransferase involved in cell wall biosynthesis